MSPFIETLKRNYQSNKISLERIEQLLIDGKITQEEFDYIVA